MFLLRFVCLFFCLFVCLFSGCVHSTGALYPFFPLAVAQAFYPYPSSGRGIPTLCLNPAITSTRLTLTVTLKRPKLTFIQRKAQQFSKFTARPFFEHYCGVFSAPAYGQRRQTHSLPPQLAAAIQCNLPVFYTLPFLAAVLLEKVTDKFSHKISGSGLQLDKKHWYTTDIGVVWTKCLFALHLLVMCD